MKLQAMQTLKDSFYMLLEFSFLAYVFKVETDFTPCLN